MPRQVLPNRRKPVEYEPSEDESLKVFFNLEAQDQADRLKQWIRRNKQHMADK